MTGNYPSKLKMGKVVPIHKKGNRHDPNNYRPISLLSAINKIIEKVLYKRLYEFFEKFNIIFRYQFGFRQDYSTTMALIEITDLIRQQIENKNVTVGIYIDLTKAFDLVNHSILMQKLENYGVRDKALKLIRSYLTERTQYTFVDSSKSDIRYIECGVPQGSVLGPLLFLIYVNDFVNCTDAKMRLFADDTNVFISDKDPAVAKQQAEECLQKLNSWLSANKLLLSEQKTNFSVFMPHNKIVPDFLNTIRIGRKLIFRTRSCKYLGLILDDKLCFDEHINQLSKDLMKVIYAFRIITNWVPEREKMKLYHAYFHSKIQYGLEIYGNAANKYIKKIEILQHRALKALFNLDWLTPTAELYNTYKVLSVKDLFSYKVVQFVHKQLSDKKTNVFSNYFKRLAHEHYPNTRNRDRLSLPKIKSENGRRIMKYTGAMSWNSLCKALKCDLDKMSYKRFVKIVKTYYLEKYKSD